MPPVIRIDGSMVAGITWDEDESPEGEAYSYQDLGGLEKKFDLATGTGVNQINDVYHDDITIPPASTVQLRLDVIPVTLFNRTYNKSLERVAQLQIHNLSLTAAVFIDQSIPNPLDFLPTEARINPGGVFHLDGDYDVVLPNDGIGLRNDSDAEVKVHVTILGVYDAENS